MQPPPTTELQPGETIVDVEINQLTLDPHNARQHGDRDIKAIMASIKKWGWINPVIVRQCPGRGTQVICGHGRIEAAKRLAMTKVPVVFRTFASDDDAKAYAIADNRTAELSGWDLPNLKNNLVELDGAGYDIAVTGWTSEELGKMLEWDSRPDKDPDAIPVEGGTTVTRPGDLWMLGDHRVLCADPTDQAAWSHLMAGRFAACVIADLGEVGEQLWRTIPNAAKFANDDAAFYLWHDSAARVQCEEALTHAGLVELQYLVWVKPSSEINQEDYRSAFEPCFYAAKSGHRPKFHGDRSLPTVWRFSPISTEGAVASVGRGLTLLSGSDSLHLTTTPSKTKKDRTLRVADGQRVLVELGNATTGTAWEVSRDQKLEHPNQKPVELAGRALRNSSAFGEVVVDPFLGSGSTIIAAETIGRACFGIERDPKYVDLCVRRWEQFTGKHAERA